MRLNAAKSGVSSVRNERFVTVLENPPVTSAVTAVKVAMASEVKEAGKGIR